MRLVQNVLLGLILVLHRSLPQVSCKDDASVIIQGRDLRLQSVMTNELGSLM